jgi:hypothetical protein
MLKVCRNSFKSSENAVLRAEATAKTSAVIAGVAPLQGKGFQVKPFTKSWKVITKPSPDYFFREQDACAILLMNH